MDSFFTRNMGHESFVLQHIRVEKPSYKIYGPGKLLTRYMDSSFARNMGHESFVLQDIRVKKTSYKIYGQKQCT